MFVQQTPFKITKAKTSAGDKMTIIIKRFVWNLHIFPGKVALNSQFKLKPSLNLVQLGFMVCSCSKMHSKRTKPSRSIKKMN